MMKTTIKELKELIKYENAVDITHYSREKLNELNKEEVWLEKIAYSSGIHGANGGLWQGHITKTLYAITNRTTTFFML